MPPTNAIPSGRLARWPVDDSPRDSVDVLATDPLEHWVSRTVRLEDGMIEVD